MLFSKNLGMTKPKKKLPTGPTKDDLLSRIGFVTPPMDGHEPLILEDTQYPQPGSLDAELEAFLRDYSLLSDSPPKGMTIYLAPPAADQLRQIADTQGISGEMLLNQILNKWEYLPDPFRQSLFH